MRGEGEVTAGGKTYNVHGGELAEFNGTEGNVTIVPIARRSPMISIAGPRNATAKKKIPFPRNMFRATPSDIPIWTTTAPGTKSPSTATCGIRTTSRLAGLLTATATGTGSAHGAGRGLIIRRGDLRRSTMAAGIIWQPLGLVPGAAIWLSPGIWAGVRRIPGWTSRVGFGVGVGVGWFPLGFGEIYHPWYRYHAGGAYIRNINIHNTYIRNVNVINNRNFRRQLRLRA